MRGTAHAMLRAQRFEPFSVFLYDARGDGLGTAIPPVRVPATAFTSADASLAEVGSPCQIVPPPFLPNLLAKRSDSSGAPFTKSRAWRERAPAAQRLTG